MEEASVAGESPDRSKQRESSAERTSGSVGPVPEARTEADEARDPRLAVARESETRSASAGGGVDTATRTRTAREAEADSGTGTGTGTGTETGSGTDTGTGTDPEAGPVAGSEAEGTSDTSDTADGDGRLRNAMASWVRPAAPEAEAAESGAGDTDAESAADGGQGAQEGEEDAQEALRAPEGADGRPGAGSGASEGAQGRAEGPEAAGSAEDATDTPDTTAAGDTDGTDDTDGFGGSSGSDDTPSKSADAEAPDTDANANTDVDGAAESPDQPTAVFKAPRPAAPSVDQPTTMLKLGGAPKETKEPGGTNRETKEPAAKGPDKSESPAERTSKFVALKPLDDPAVRKPSQTGPQATPETPAPAPAPAPAAEGFERTRQQPLPPKPPLDLLAELTNTPPPPETPLRTAWRRVKIWTPLVLLLVIVFAVVQAVRPLPAPTLQLTAQETVSFGGDEPSMPWPTQGQAAMDVNGIGSFGTSGDQKPVPIASIAKVMTVYLILRDHPLKTGEKGPEIPVDAAAQKHYETGKAENESVVKVTEGQKITEYEALQAVMLPSANNIAKLLARWDTGSSSEDEFVAKMNKTAEELGMKNTTYTDPSGLDKTTVSTAEDLVKLGRAAMEDPVFKEISRQPSYVDLNGDQQNNFFGLVPTVAIGIKTGTTTAAGGNILFAAEKTVGGKTQTIIGAALGQFGQNGTANIDEVTAVVRGLIEAGQDALTAKTIVKKGDVVGQVDDGLGGTTPVVATKDVSAVGWSGLTVKLELDEAGDGSVPHTAKAGTEVGTLTVGDGKSSTVKVPVALGEDLAEPAFANRLTRIS
ncbi:D-alanyl-D-alanine carboxypeptidase [Streptomyces sp. enrichment culture]|uniref:D-alanyl-D-alanine carboxypeptidase n=1 Tax=Streptomyces sp. enrichment culture TaxID=1795815 RepID=UPI003F5504A8